MYKKDLKTLEIKLRIQDALDKLDNNKIHIIYFCYYFNLHNIWHSPLLISTKLLALFTRQKSIDHVAHISRFTVDGQTNKRIVKVFEANTKRGMEENDLFDKLKSFQGICYIHTIDKIVDKDKAREFKKRYYGVPYSKVYAWNSGIDISLLEIDKGSQTKPKRVGGFCSWLVALFLRHQGVDISHIENGNPKEITPANLFYGNLAKTEILYQYNK